MTDRPQFVWLPIWKFFAKWYFCTVHYASRLVRLLTYTACPICYTARLTSKIYQVDTRLGVSATQLRSSKSEAMHKHTTAGLRRIRRLLSTPSRLGKTRKAFGCMSCSGAQCSNATRGQLVQNDIDFQEKRAKKELKSARGAASQTKQHASDCDAKQVHSQTRYVAIYSSSPAASSCANRTKPEQTCRLRTHCMFSSHLRSVVFFFVLVFLLLGFALASCKQPEFAGRPTEPARSQRALEPAFGLLFRAVMFKLNVHGTSTSVVQQCKTTNEKSARCAKAVKIMILTANSEAGLAVRVPTKTIVHTDATHVEKQQQPHLPVLNIFTFASNNFPPMLTDRVGAFFSKSSFETGHVWNRT